MTAAKKLVLNTKTIAGDDDTLQSVISQGLQKDFD